MSTPNTPLKRNFHTYPAIPKVESDDFQTAKIRHKKVLDHSAFPDSSSVEEPTQDGDSHHHSSWVLKAEQAYKMTEKYNIVKPLDKGSFGEVSVATLVNSAPSGSGTATVTCTGPSIRKTHPDSGIFVIKKIDKEKANDTLISNEIEAGTRLVEHHAIPKFIETYTDSRYCYMIFEYFNGMNLYNYLESRNFKPLKEHHAKKIMRPVTDALIYSHSHKVCHRDLKLENILYNPKRKQARLIDFGLCAINSFSCADLCSNWCGSPDYVCPEILIQQPYSGCLSDVWSLGVILYVLVCGQMPFNFKERYRALQRGDPHPSLDFPSEKDLPYKISDSVKDLIKKMLTVDPRQRISMEEVPYHKWMMKKSSNLLSMFGIKPHVGDHHKSKDHVHEKPSGDHPPAHTEPRHGDEKHNTRAAVQGRHSPKLDHSTRQEAAEQDQGRAPQTQM